MFIKITVKVNPYNSIVVYKRQTFVWQQINSKFIHIMGSSFLPLQFSSLYIIKPNGLISLLKNVSIIRNTEDLPKAKILPDGIYHCS